MLSATGLRDLKSIIPPQQAMLIWRKQCKYHPLLDKKKKKKCRLQSNKFTIRKARKNIGAFEKNIYYIILYVQV